ncbi:MAG: hypothetical protein ACI8QC_004075 [Planctomycetota bacterium]|jgi:hypothetical protein
MITSVLFTLLAAPVPPAPCLSVSPSSSIVVQDETPADEVDPAKVIEAAGTDVEKILELARAWKKDRKSKESKAAFARVLELDAENEEAHKGLRHQRYDNQWFKSYSAMAAYRREETKRMADKGLARYGDEWVPITDVPYLKMGWAKDENGKWDDPFYIQKAAHAKAMTAEKRTLRMEDSTWVLPADFEKWNAGLWQVGEEWVSVEEANTFHAEIDNRWQTRGKHFEVSTTCNMDTLLYARWYADLAYPDLVKIFGLEPKHAPHMVVFKSMDQFNVFAAGDGDAGRQPAEASGFSSLHHAYFADSWYDLTSTPPRYLGTGVAYWDISDQNTSAFGLHSVRHAAGLAYAEAITPSVQTIGDAISAGAPPDLGEFWAEKAIPRWLFYGGASYVERFFMDEGKEDPWWARSWSITNITAGGELDALDRIFEFGLSLDAIPESTRLINEAGLVVSFIMDGGCAPVTAAHEAYKKALIAGEDTEESIKALQDTIIANKAAFDGYVAGA